MHPESAGHVVVDGSKRRHQSPPPFHRIVDGAIRNARHAHPQITITRSQRQSIVKRAAGTLSAFWADTLAAGPSHGDRDDGLLPVRKSSPATLGANGRGVRAKRHPPLARLKAKLTRGMWRITREEHPEYARAMIDVLRMISKLSPGMAPLEGVHDVNEGPGAS